MGLRESLLPNGQVQTTPVATAKLVSVLTAADKLSSE
jgi:hypothetical protein